MIDFWATSDNVRYVVKSQSWKGYRYKAKRYDHDLTWDMPMLEDQEGIDNERMRFTEISISLAPKNERPRAELERVMADHAEEISELETVKEDRAERIAELERVKADHAEQMAELERGKANRAEEMLELERGKENRTKEMAKLERGKEDRAYINTSNTSPQRYACCPIYACLV